VRNKFFDWGILPSARFSIPIISLGNLSSGGTGKTPHVEYLASLLGNKYKIAVLSRGYKRKTRGFLIANNKHKASQVGDEPLQICLKFPEIIVAVHENRSKGIKEIMKRHPEVNLIILDDAFQHRYVKPGLNILLTEYYKPFFRNYILPCGDLREPKSGVKRAHALIITKTPDVFSPLDRRFFLRNLSKYGLKNVFFSRIEYGDWIPLNWQCQPSEKSFKTIILCTGIANTTSIEEYLKRRCDELLIKRFPDHYQFSVADLMDLKKQFRDIFGKSKAIIITEKDAMRLQEKKLMDELKDLPIFYIPIKIVFQNGDQINFEKLITSYLSENQLLSA